MKRAARPVRSHLVTANSTSNSPRRARVLAAAALSSAAVAALSQTAMAQSLYWDRNGTTAGTSATSTGSWDLASPNWGTINGDTAPGAWASGNIAVFSAGSNGTGTFTVTVPT